MTRNAPQKKVMHQVSLTGILKVYGTSVCTDYMLEYSYAPVLIKQMGLGLLIQCTMRCEPKKQTKQKHNYKLCVQCFVLTKRRPSWTFSLLDLV